MVVEIRRDTSAPPLILEVDMSRFSRAGKVVAQKLLLLMAKRNYYLMKGNVDDKINYTIDPIMNGPWTVSVDIVRSATLELISCEISQYDIEGAIAEVGVFQGDFSRLIAHFFPDRRFYLFDTFEGFDSRDREYDERENLTDLFHEFNKTNLKSVITKIPSDSRVVIKKGWFPDTAIGLEDEKFCFVSLDVDLYKPTMAGLTWFYPRLSPGGYILVHDFNSNNYRGARKAVREFVKEYGASYVPIPDTGGTVVISKAPK